MPIIYGAHDRRPVSKRRLLKNSVAYSCVTMVARSVSSIPVSVILPQEIEDDARNDVIRLVQKPNAKNSLSVLLYRITEDLLIYGRSYLLRNTVIDHITESIDSIYHINNQHLKEYFNNHNILTGYSYFSKKGWVDEKIDALGKCNVLMIDHFSRALATSSVLRDSSEQLSPCDVIQSDLELCNLIDEYNSIAIEKCNKFNGIIELHNVSDAMVEKVRSYIQNNPPGAPLCFTNTTVQWKNIQSDNNVYDIEGHKHVMKNIARVFGVPAMLIGLQDSNGQYQYESARRHFWEDTVLPLTLHILNAIENWLDEYYSGIRLKPEWNSVAAFSDAWFEYAEKINKLDFLTRDEKRELCNTLFQGKAKDLKAE